MRERKYTHTGTLDGRSQRVVDFTKYNLEGEGEMNEPMMVIDAVE